MTNKYDTIGNFLGVAIVEEEKQELTVIDNNSIEIRQNLENEKFDNALEYVNGNMKNIIDKSMSGLNEVLSIMEASQEAKMYQAAAGYIKTLVDANRAYLDNNKPTTKMVNSKAESQQKGTVTNIQVNGENVSVTAQTAQSLLDDLD